jgi:phage shock protein C
MNKRLFRSKTNRQIAGVCGGLAEYFNVDPTIVRVLFVIGTLLGGPGLILYIILAVVVPDEATLYEKAKNTLDE